MTGELPARSAAGRFRLDGEWFDVVPPAPGLYVVSTPIGNLRDVTIRALETLAGCNLVACEDTRHSATLLRHFGIDRPLIAYHEYSGAGSRERIMAALAAGDAVALISDAGTPLISDPGYRLSRMAIDMGYPVFPVPGPSSVLAALVASGLPTDRFHFSGFLPTRQKARRDELSALAGVHATLVVMEAPHRLGDSLADMADILGADREAAVCRELSKLHETVVRRSLGDLATHYRAEPAKGEVVVVIGPPAAGAGMATDREIDAALTEALQTHSLRDAVQQVTSETGARRRRVYDRALDLKK